MRFALLGLAMALALPGEEIRGTWSATSGPRNFSGAWTAQIEGGPSEAWGTWAVLDAGGRVVLGGTWSANKMEKEWRGAWRAQAPGSAGYLG
ncbi:MAG: hypothetical protein ACRD96_02870, partial [Bryobacteraceae bacterium]